MNDEDLKIKHPAIYARMVEIKNNDETFHDTVEGLDFWELIVLGNYDLFYERYPKDVYFDKLAQELVAEFAQLTDTINNRGAVDHDLWNERSKKCALIHIKRMKEELLYYAELQMLTNWGEAIKYWDKMKTAVEGL